MPWTYWTGNEIKGRWHAPLGLAMHKWKFTVTIKTKNWEGLNIQAMKVQNPESRHGKGTCYCICRIFKVRHRFCIHCSNFCSGGKTQGSNPKNLRVTLEERCGTVSSERWLEPDGGRYSRAHFELQKTFSYQPRSGYGLLHTTALSTRALFVIVHLKVIISTRDFFLCLYQKGLVIYPIPWLYKLSKHINSCLRLYKI